MYSLFEHVHQQLLILVGVVRQVDDVLQILGEDHVRRRTGHKVSHLALKVVHIM